MACARARATLCSHAATCRAGHSYGRGYNEQIIVDGEYTHGYNPGGQT